MLDRWLRVITAVASMVILWALVVPGALSWTLFVGAGLLVLLALTTALLGEKTRRARSITQMLDDLEVEAPSVTPVPSAAARR
jgi:hypothetical protein